MLDDRAFLAALQLADSFFPTGMYAHSHGLEGAARGLVATAPQLEEFIWSILPADGVALHHSHAAANQDLGRLCRIDHLLEAIKLPSESRAASTQLGRRLLAETAAIRPSPIHTAYAAAVARRQSPGNGAPALAVAAQAGNIPAGQALLVFSRGHAVSVLGAAMRLVQTSHTDAQAILGRLHSRLPPHRGLGGPFFEPFGH